MSYAELITRRPSKISRNYSGTYWGSQNIKTLPPRLTEKAKEIGNYIDLTAGGAGYPFFLAENGVSVHVNDRNVYAISNHRTVFSGDGCDLKKDIDKWFEEFCKKTHPKNVKPVEGYSLSRIGKDFFSISEQLAKYIDGLLVSKNPLIMASVGRTLVKACSFRAYWWSKKSADKRLTNEITDEEFWAMTMRVAWSLRLYAERIKNTGSTATDGDALAAISKIRAPEKTVVYTDPAWPWAKSFGVKKNPYEFFTNQVGSILKQKEISVDKINFWSNQDEERTYKDVHSWMSKAAEVGCPFFCLSNQDTNSPEPEGLYDRLGNDFKLVWLEKNVARSASANKNYHDYFAMYEL